MHIAANETCSLPSSSSSSSSSKANVLMITNLCTMLTHLCFQTKPSMLLVSKSVLAYLVTIKEVARVELHPWSGGGDGQSAA